MSLNKVFLLGRVGQDPVVRHYESNSFANFSLATGERYKDKTGAVQERTDWHNIVVTGKSSVKVVEDYVKKGTQLMIEGKIRHRKYEQNGQEKYITEIYSDRFELLGRPVGASPEGKQENQTATEIPMPDMSDYQEQVDDLPF